MSTVSDRLKLLDAATNPHTVYRSIAEVAMRWGCSVTAVRAIPASALPYLNIGTGLVREHRRYHPDDIAAYEATRHRKAS